MDQLLTGDGIALKKGNLYFYRHEKLDGVQYAIGFKGVIPETLVEGLVGRHPEALVEGFNALRKPKWFAFMCKSRITSIKNVQGHVMVKLKPPG